MGMDLDRHALNNLQAKVAQAVDLGGVVGKQADALAAQAAQNLRATPVFAQVRGESEGLVGLNGVHAILLQAISLDLVDEADAAALLAHVEDDAATFLFNLRHGAVQLVAAVATPGTEDVAGEAHAVHGDGVAQGNVLQNLARLNRQTAGATSGRNGNEGADFLDNASKHATHPPSKATRTHAAP